MSSSTRLFIGNLPETADEYTLVQFLSKHGKISKLDFLFHKAGPRKGKPRGYAFVEYATKEEALKTMLELNDKLIQGRKVSIKRANDAPEYSQTNTGSGAWRGGAPKPTTLSILKGHKKPETRDNKISALEAKLAALEAEKQELASSREASADLGEGPSSSFFKPATKAERDADNLPKKPSSDVIATGEKLELQEQERKQGEDRSRSRGHGQRTGSRRTAAEAPKSTLASLGAGFSKDG